MFLGENKHYSHTMKCNIVVKINVSIHILTWINLEIKTLSLKKLSTESFLYIITYRQTSFNAIYCALQILHFFQIEGLQ